MSVLAEYARPLSRKRLYRLCRENLEEMGASEQSEFEEAIAVALGAGVLSESRPGVIGIPRKGTLRGSQRAPQKSASRKDDRTRRKRISRQAKAQAGFPAAPISLEETAAMSVQASDRTQLSDAWQRPIGRPPRLPIESCGPWSFILMMKALEPCWTVLPATH